MDNPTLREKVRQALGWDCEDHNHNGLAESVACREEQQVSAIMSLISEAEARGKAIVVEAVMQKDPEKVLTGPVNNYDHYDCWKAQWRHDIEAARNA